MDADRLLRDLKAGHTAALARAISVVENARPGFERLLAEIHRDLGHARRIGITGPPGAGKSTLVERLVGAYRAEGLRVAVVAVDPTSPFTGGALLGDRIRMESVALDRDVYIRSMATRGSLGGLATTTREVCDVLDAAGFDRIVVETVGVGQSELDVGRMADSTVLVLVPESGDGIQTLKSGVMEVADIFVVNKADRPGADRVRTDIELMLGMRTGEALRNMPAHHGVDLKKIMNPARIAREAASADQTETWTPPVLRTVASKGEGIEELITALDRHVRYLAASGELKRRRRQRLREQVIDVTEHKIRQRLWRDDDTNAFIDSMLPALESGTATPFTVAEQLLSRSGQLLTRTRS